MGLAEREPFYGEEMSCPQRLAFKMLTASRAGNLAVTDMFHLTEVITPDGDGHGR
jgi:hypothetical protein